MVLLPEERNPCYIFPVSSDPIVHIFGLPLENTTYRVCCAVSASPILVSCFMMLQVTRTDIINTTPNFGNGIQHNSLSSGRLINFGMLNCRGYLFIWFCKVVYKVLDVS